MPEEPIQPIFVLDTFTQLRIELLDILGQLNALQWQQPTACEGWSVHDVAVHLLGDDIGLLSSRRDGHGEDVEIGDYEELIAWINYRNDIWVKAMRRLSPSLLIHLLRDTGEQEMAFWRSLDLFEDGGVVSWAGPDPAPVWLEMAREYTEFWMHTQHICEGAGIVALRSPEYMFPLLDTFVRAMPHTYRHIIAPEGSVVKLHIPDVDGMWFIRREGDAWVQYAELDESPVASVMMPADVAWRVFTKGMTPEKAAEHATITGDPALAEPLLSMVSIMA
ncbi:maleylpyruvate isomerase family mycothiol-dependent enzyme [Phototrophicus methaneseepsis]|uniref:Maleylpyruvate isomerase family mycothiol-dependent enzyme n=1 Tax=Phototrophicus methaneseepsis TaxID=2710758 RepID=A0A7S8E973_9CHLR|nr:maleylpyruvate isomerase family mycothiol-dependent enzyme [Phototrophicus methaneseepsis]QPC82564.1 maleylpyruvate isomerase family mycothiol-dependent enzyme [Phototrophicus methaneseepsis]